jgi:hypothetical protein
MKTSGSTIQLPFKAFGERKVARPAQIGFRLRRLVLHVRATRLRHGAQLGSKIEVVHESRRRSAGRLRAGGADLDRDWIQRRRLARELADIVILPLLTS